MAKSLELLPIEIMELVTSFLELKDVENLKFVSKAMYNQLIGTKTAKYIIGNEKPFISFKDQYSPNSIHPTINFLALQLAVVKFVKTLPDKTKLSDAERKQFIKILNQGVVLNAKMIEFIKNANPACYKIIRQLLDLFDNPYAFDLTKTHDIALNVRDLNNDSLASHLVEAGHYEHLHELSKLGANLELENRFGRNILSRITSDYKLLPKLRELLPEAILQKINDKKEKLLKELKNGNAKLPVWSSNNPINAAAYHLILEDAIKNDDDQLFTKLNDLHVLYDTKLVTKTKCKEVVEFYQKQNLRFLKHFIMVKDNIFSNFNLETEKANFSINDNELTNIHTIVRLNFSEEINYLITSDVDFNIRDEDQETPIYRIENNANIELLIKAGVNPNARNKDGNTPLHIAIEFNIKATDELIKAGANINARNEAGITPLHIAIKRHQIDTADKLIKAGADINIVDNDGNAPLHIAIINSKYKSSQRSPYIFVKTNTQDIILLIKSGADVNAKDRLGRTPIQLALIHMFKHTCYLNFSSCLEVFYELIQAGADVNAKDKFGRTVLDQALLVNNQKIIITLLDAGAKSSNISNTKLALDMFPTIFSKTSLKEFYNLLCHNTHKILKKLDQPATDLLLTEITAALRAQNVNDEGINKVKNALKALIQAKNLESNDYATRNTLIKCATVSLLITIAALGITAGKNISIINTALNSLSHRAKTSEMFSAIKQCIDFVNSDRITQCFAIAIPALFSIEFAVLTTLEIRQINSQEYRNFGKFVHELEKVEYNSILARS